MKLTGIFVRNRVAANLVMLVIVALGVYSAITLRRELFPMVQAEQILITVPYPGGTPDDIENGVTQRIEREVKDLEGLDEIRSRILEGMSITTLVLEEDADRESVLNEVRGEIDKVKRELPEAAEDPEVVLARPYFPVISIVIHGDAAEERLHAAAIRVRKELQGRSGIAQVVISGIRDREIWVEVDPLALETHGLSFADVGRRVQEANLDLPAGQLETAQGNLRVRTDGEERQAVKIEDLIVKTGVGGSAIRLRDLAKVRETFEDRVEQGRFGGRRAALITVFKTPEQDAIELADTVKAYIKDNPTLCEGALKLDPLNDLSRFVAQRFDLMSRNASAGLVLVAISLGIFLSIEMAMWVTMGLIISFLGCFVVMDGIGGSFNLISLFGLIIVLGLIVDDAIVVAENIFRMRRKGMAPTQASLEGTRQVQGPVIAAVLTTIMAFGPLAFLEGSIGSFMREIPLVVIAALGVSLFESLTILPAHLSHRSFIVTIIYAPVMLMDWIVGRVLPAFRAEGRRVSERGAALRTRVFEGILPDLLAWVLKLAIPLRYPVLACALAVLIASFGLVAGDVVPFVFLQDSEAETVAIDVEMTAGTTEEQTLDVLARIEKAALDQAETRAVFTVLGTSFTDRGLRPAADPAGVGQVTVELHPSEWRQDQGLLAAKEWTNRLKARIGNPPGVVKLKYAPRGGGPQGSDIELRLEGEDLETLLAAGAKVKERLAAFKGVSQIEDDVRRGKLELRYRLRDTARPLGLSTRDLAGQLRNALVGFEVQELQEPEEERKLRVLLPDAARDEASDLLRLRLVTPNGQRIPLEEAAELETGRGWSELARADAIRALTIQADVDNDTANTNAITQKLARELPQLLKPFPGVGFSFQGAKKQTGEAFGPLQFFFPLALFLIYAIIAVIFSSYFQPALVMFIIPFALVGALLGHLVMGYPITLLSVVGFVALTGIVVNDSLILVDFINKARAEGVPLREATVQASRTRLRAILLTSVTTCLGLTPLMFERSYQAQFLIPMAVSIVFGLLLATTIIPILLPLLYLVVEDIRCLFRWLATGHWKPRAQH